MLRARSIQSLPGGDLDGEQRIKWFVQHDRDLRGQEQRRIAVAKGEAIHLPVGHPHAPRSLLLSHAALA
jgi:hypothetical protein